MPIDKITTQYPTGNNLYALIYNKDQEVAYPTGKAFETYGTSGRDASDYAIAMSEIAGTGYYYASWPTWMDNGTYSYVMRIRAGSTPVNGDTGFGPWEKYWTGTALAAEPDTNAVAICNQGLLLVGGKKDAQVITSLGDGTPTSDACDLIYHPIRKTVIARGYFQETIKYGECAENTTWSGEQADWEYVFDLPSDYIKLIRQCHEDSPETEYRSEVIQGKLFSNVYSNSDGDAAYIKYKWNETDGDNFSQELVNCIAHLIGASLAPQILGVENGGVRRHYLLEEYEKYILPTNDGVAQSVQYKRDIFRSKWKILGGRVRKDF